MYVSCVSSGVLTQHKDIQTLLALAIKVFATTSFHKNVGFLLIQSLFKTTQIAILYTNDCQFLLLITQCTQRAYHK